MIRVQNFGNNAIAIDEFYPQNNEKAQYYWTFQQIIIVSIMMFFFGGGGGSRTPVRKKDQKSISERSP